MRMYDAPPQVHVWRVQLGPGRIPTQPNQLKTQIQVVLGWAWAWISLAKPELGMDDLALNWRTHLA